jgi:tetratricopeptide (TPR) repeat protein
MGERFRLRASDRMMALPLPPSQQRALERLLASYPEIEAAYLVGKVLHGLTDDPARILAVRFAVPWYRYHDSATTRAFEKLAEDPTLADLVDAAVVPVRSGSELRRWLDYLKGALCYQRGKAVGFRPIRPGQVVSAGRMSAAGWVLAGLGALVVVAALAVWSRVDRGIGVAIVVHGPQSGSGRAPPVLAEVDSLLIRDQLDSALVVLRRARAEHPENTAVRHGMAWTLSLLGRFEEAAREFEEAIASAPRDGALRASYARALFGLGRMRAAQDQASKAVNLEPDNPRVLEAAAIVAFGWRRFADCLGLLRRATELEPDVAFFWTMRALTAYFTNRHEEAAWAFNQARRLQPEVVRAGGWPIDLAEVERSLEQEGMFRAVESTQPTPTPFTETDRLSDSTNASRSARDLALEAERAQSIVKLRADPDSILLHPGDTLAVGRLGIRGENAGGETVDNLRWLIEFRPPGIVELKNWRMATAVKPGRTVLEVSPTWEVAEMDSVGRGPGLRIPIVVR